MLFIGHFSFDDINKEGAAGHGYFSCIVNAETPESAVTGFERHIRQMKESLEEMQHVVNVYIEDIVRIASIPETPMITRIQSSRGEFPPSVSHALPEGENEYVDVFGYTPDVDKQEAPGDERFVEAEPFITFSQ